jgi:hypothetical protein
MRQGLFILAVLLFAAHAAAQDDEEQGAKKKKKEDAAAQDEKGDKKKKKGKDEEEDKAQGPSMDTGAEPSETERTERGPYSPTAAAQKTKVGKGEAKEEPQEKPRPARKKLQLFGEAVIGWGSAPIPGPGNDRTTEDAFGFVFMAGASYDVSPRFTLGLRVPWTTASFDQANGGSLSSQALGHPELSAEYRVKLGARADLPIGLGVGIPVAQGNADRTGTDTAGLRQWDVNLFADAVTGWHDGELFVAQHLPIVPFVGVVYEGENLDLDAYTKLVLAPNLSTKISQPNDPNNLGTFEANGMALRSVTGGGAAYWFLESPRISAGLDAWAVINAVEPVSFKSASGAAGPSAFQFVIEPRLAAMFGPARPSVGYIWPIGGRLSDAGAQGIRLRLDIGF